MELQEKGMTSKQPKTCVNCGKIILSRCYSYRTERDVFEKYMEWKYDPSVNKYCWNCYQDMVGFKV